MCFPRVIEAPVALAHEGYPVWWGCLFLTEIENVHAPNELPHRYHSLCQIFGAMPITSPYISVFILSVVSVERYLSIVKSISFTQHQAYLAVGCIWLACIVIGVVLPVITAVVKGTPASPYIVQSSGLYCLINWGDGSVPVSKRLRGFDFLIQVRTTD